MKRALVLTNEAARHPFRQRLPVQRVAMSDDQAFRKRPARSDLAFFGISFVGFFVIIMGMTI